jgi:DNA-binding NarL/FixJ family response regulator
MVPGLVTRGRRVGPGRDASRGAWLRPQGCGGEETLRAIRVAAGGEAIFSPTIAQRLADYFAAPAKGSATPPAQAHREQQQTPVSEYPAGLTAREVEVEIGPDAKDLSDGLSISSYSRTYFKTASW